jgi:hypothetical protein
MKAAADFFQALMAKVRHDLYKGKPDKTWFAQQKMIKKALLHPAVYLHKQRVELPAARYRAILEDIINTIVAKGNLDRVDYMSRYFLFCVQKHMEHHGDQYYAEGKAIRNRVDLVMGSVEKAARGADSTVPILAEADKLLQMGKRKARVKPVATAPTPDLFNL